MEPHWDSGPDPGVPEAGDTGAVTVGPQIPHPVAPALVSQAGGGGGTWCQAGLGVLLGQGREGRKHVLGREGFSPVSSARHCAGY